MSVRSCREFGAAQSLAGLAARLFSWIALLLMLAVGGNSVRAADARFTFPKQYSMSAKGVNLQNGRFSYSAVDLSIGPLTLTRSLGDGPLFRVSRMFGPSYFSSGIYSSWGHSFAQGSFAATGDSLGNLIIFIVDGRELRFRVSPNFDFLPQDKGTQGNRLSYQSGNWALVDRSGNTYNFQPHPSQSQSGYSYNVNQLLYSVVYADGSRLDYTYNASGQVRSVQSSKGYAIIFDYNASNNLAAACGFNLTQSTVSASTTCAAAPHKVSYGYNAAGTLLTSVTDAGSGMVTISYVTAANAPWPSCISYRNSATCEVSNQFGGVILTKPDQVTQQTTATGGSWSYQFDNGEDPADLPIVAGRPRWTFSYMQGNAELAETRYDRGLLVDYVGSAGSYAYRYAIATFILPTTSTFSTATVDYRGTLPTLITSAAGDVEYFEYNLRGNMTRRATLPRSTNIAALTLTTGGAFLPTDTELAICCVNAGTLNIPAGSTIVSQSFLPDWGGVGLYGQYYAMGCGVGPADDKRCGKAVAQIDAKGNQTDYVYSAVHGGILSETGPAPLPGGVRPQTRYTYEQRQPYILAAGGGVVASGPPIWVLTAKSMCKTSQWTGSACAAANDEVRTTYEYGPTTGVNNLNLRGEVVDSGGLSLRTCYAYDWRGMRTSVTTPRAGLGVCQ